MPNLEVTEEILVHWDLVNNSYQQDSRALYTIILNKPFGQLFDISSKNFIFLKTFNSEFLHFEIWYTDRNLAPRDIR